MQLDPPPHWYEYPFSCLGYLLASTADHLLIFAAGCLILFLVSLCLRIRYFPLFQRWGAFSVVLLLVGTSVSGLWDCLIYGRFYVTASYFSDFSPFVPVTQSVIDRHFDGYSGHLIGVSIRQLQLVWVLFALATWALAFKLSLRAQWFRPISRSRT